uniref:Uncharacterized protein n=1 Tax=Arundo donax TaxID=35708 RepID=A0A0A9CCC7_ARUDO
MTLHVEVHEKTNVQLAITSCLASL